MISEFLFFSLIHISGYTSKYILMLYKRYQIKLWLKLANCLIKIYTWSYVKHIEYRFLMQSKTKTL